MIRPITVLGGVKVFDFVYLFGSGLQLLIIQRVSIQMICLFAFCHCCNTPRVLLHFVQGKSNKKI